MLAHILCHVKPLIFKKFVESVELLCIAKKRTRSFVQRSPYQISTDVGPAVLNRCFIHWTLKKSKGDISDYLSNERKNVKE